MLTLAAAAIKNLAFRLSNMVYSSSFRYILCLTRSFYRLDVLSWPGFAFFITDIAASVSALSLSSVTTLAGVT